MKTQLGALFWWAVHCPPPPHCDPKELLFNCFEQQYVRKMYKSIPYFVGKTKEFSKPVAQNFWRKFCAFGALCADCPSFSLCLDASVSIKTYFWYPKAQFLSKFLILALPSERLPNSPCVPVSVKVCCAPKREKEPRVFVNEKDTLLSAM